MKIYSKSIGEEMVIEVEVKMIRNEHGVAVDIVKFADK